MTASFSSSHGFFMISWKNKHSNLKPSVTVSDFIKAMTLYLNLKVDKAELWHFPQDGSPSVVRRTK